MLIIGFREKTLAILCLLITCLYLVSFSNVSHVSRFQTYNSNLNLYVTNIPPPSSSNRKFIESHKKSFSLFDSPPKGERKAFCLNNKDPFNMTTVQRMREFVKGPCAPLVVVPGIMATSLQVEITNCSLFKEKYPKQFSDCGWRTCEDTWANRVWSRIAPKEVKLWVSVSRLLSPWASSSTCFGDLAFLRLNKSASDPSERYTSIDGIRVTWLGNTPETKKDSDCGVSAIIDYAGYDFLGCELRGFDIFTDYLKGLGYESGLTFQAMPYDFRKAYIYNDLRYQLLRSVKMLYELTGKKVVLFAHSLGNLNMLPFLNEMQQSDKDKMLKLFFSAGAPFTGATKALRCEIGGETNFYFMNTLGLDMEGQKGFLGGATGMFDAFPKDTYFRFAKETWMQELVQRIEMEENYDVGTDEGKVFWEGRRRKGNIELNWFPNPLDECNGGNFKVRGKECRTHMKNMKNVPIVKIGTDEYFATESDLRRLSASHIATSNITSELYEDALATGNNLLRNPGVPTLLLYGAFEPTELTVEFETSVSNATKQNKLSKPINTVFGVGDGTILATSTITAGAKWIWEHNREFVNSKAIKVLEYCSSNSNEAPIYERSAQGNSTTDFRESRYIGRSCSCMGSGDFKSCKHSCYISEPEFLKILKEAVTTEEPGTFPEDLTDETLQDMQNECYSLTLPGEVSDILKFARQTQKEKKKSLEK